jgi:hypothetical protein
LGPNKKYGDWPALAAELVRLNVGRHRDRNATPPNPRGNAGDFDNPDRHGDNLGSGCQ